MSKTKRLFISDIHLGSGRTYDKFQTSKHQDRLLGFLENEVIAKKGSIKDLILLGDTFDTWTCPYDKKPPTYSAIFNNQQEIIEKLNKVTENGIALYIGHGNHDFDLTQHEIQTVIPKIILINDTTSYMTGRIRAEHGHIRTLFNNPDWKRDPAFGRSIGYFIARLATRRDGKPEYKDIRAIISYVDDLLEAGLTHETLFSSILEGLSERINAKKIKMPNGSSLSINKLKKRYAHLEDSPTIIARKTWNEYDLGVEADHLCKRNGYRVVVFGHTHRAKIDNDSFLLRENRIHANCGAWCEDKAHFVEIDKTSASVEVVLHEVDDNGKSKDQDGFSLSKGSYRII